jgi:hypothetical protein
MKAIEYYSSFHAVALSMMLLAAIELMTGCGAAARSCTYTNFPSVAPATATADHVAVAPGDQQQFSAFSQREPTTASAGCAVPTANPTNITKLTPAWTVSDSANVKISSAQDATNGLATCLGTTKSPVTITALGSTTPGGVSQILATATLTCK